MTMKTSDKIKDWLDFGFIVMAALPLFLLWGCDGFVDVELPNSQLTADAVFDSRSTANAAMTDIYSQMRESGLITGKLSGTSSLLGNYSDELVSYETGGYSTADFYNNSLVASSPVVSDLWNAAYSQIYATNAVYNKTAVSPLAVADKQQFMGEALFVRALEHFYLVNLFGDIPYIKTNDYRENNVVSRMPVEDVYANVIADLEEAIELLPAAYPTDDRARPDKAVAQALLARVYLYHGDWAEASNMASAVINNDGVYVWEEDLDHIFLRESTTTIWQLASAYDGHNTDETVSFNFPVGPPTNVALSETLLGQFTADDQRRIHWTQAVTDGAETWYHPNKYREREDTGSSLEFSIVLRLAEQYLIRAESRARQGELIGAREDLNKIRNTAGLSDTDAVTQEEFVAAVLQERRLELFTEYGHRFFDLKRTGQLDAVLSGKPGWNSTDVLWPLPQHELQVNPALKPQNAGY